MALEWWVNTTGTTWKKVTEAYVNTDGGTTWKEVTEGYVNTTGTTWKQFYDNYVPPTLDSSTVVWDDNNEVENDPTVNCGCQCDAAKKSNCVCIKWNHTGCINNDHHIEIMKSTGGSYTIAVDDKICDNLAAVWCRDVIYDGEVVAPGPTSCWTGPTVYVKVRIAADGTHGTVDEGNAHGPSNMTNCGVAL
jgi:hypothetical protein